MTFVPYINITHIDAWHDAMASEKWKGIRLFYFPIPRWARNAVSHEGIIISNHIFIVYDRVCSKCVWLDKAPNVKTARLLFSISYHITYIILSIRRATKSIRPGNVDTRYCLWLVFYCCCIAKVYRWLIDFDISRALHGFSCHGNAAIWTNACTQSI